MPKPPDPLHNVFDVHAHAHPDRTKRSIDALELAKLYEERGLRGMVLENHHDPTAGLAYLARKEAPELEVFGGIVLNRLVGGLNCAAIQHMAGVEGGLGRVVWMPTCSRRPSPSSTFWPSSVLCWPPDTTPPMRSCC